MEPWSPGLNVDVQLPSVKEADIPAGLAGELRSTALAGPLPLPQASDRQLS